MDQIDCETCKGSGKVPREDYRVNARIQEKSWEEIQVEEKMKKEKEARKVLLRRIFLSCIAFPFVISGCGIWARSCKESAKADTYNDNKSGILLVEYDASNKSINCYVEREGTYYTGGIQKIVKLNDRHDDDEVADLAKILHWEESTQGKCYRFKYDFDSK